MSKYFSFIVALLLAFSAVDLYAEEGNNKEGNNNDGAVVVESNAVVANEILSLRPSYLNGQMSSCNEIDFGYDFYDAYQNQKPVTHNYSIWDDATWAGIPFVAAGFLVKGVKKDFREARNKLNGDFHNRTDDILQFAPLAATFVIKAVGVEGRSNWGRFLVSSAFSYMSMALFVNAIKYSAKEMRPDGTTANSFPSGHTATAFAGATILHKEYGMTRSPIYSVLGYAAATTTGVMRSLNNRHWISDIMVGAGLGIIATDVGYMIAGAIFRDKGIKRDYMTDMEDFEKYPSFISVSIGAMRMDNLHLPSDFISASGFTPTEDGKLRLGTGSTVGFEGAYFFNKYFGVGGKGRVNIAPVRANGMNAYEIDEGKLIPYKETSKGDETDQLATYMFDIGPYFSIPFTKKLSLDMSAFVGYMHNSDFELICTDQQDLKWRDIKKWTKADLEKFIAEGHYIGDMIMADESNNLKFGAGLSLSWAVQNNLCIDLNFSYDYAKVPYNMGYFSDAEFAVNYELTKDFQKSVDAAWSETSIKKSTNMFGGGVSISFSF